MNSKYPRIIFNNKLLPEGAISLDFCASGNFFEDIDNELSLWFWKFTNCVGVSCSEPSDRVIEFASKLRLLLTGNEERVRKQLKNKYEPQEAYQIYDWWIATLNIMIKTAEKNKVSRWHGVEDS